MVERPGKARAGATAASRPVRVMLLTVGLDVGGTEAHILELASRLDPRRYRATVCGLKGDGCIARELRLRGIPVATLGATGRLDVRVLPRLLRLIRRERPDVLHAFLFRANLLARVAGRLLRVPVVISSYHELELLRVPRYRLLDRWTARWSSAMSCCSDAVRTFILDRVGGAPARYVTIPFGVDPDRFRDVPAADRRALGLPAEGPVIGTVCRLVEPTKGLSVLLRAFAQLTRERPETPARLLIVGEGPALEPLRRQAAALGIAPAVVFTGLQRDIPRLLPLMALFVLPSRYEGFGLAILEALAAGTPVVATAVGGIPEIVTHGKTGLLVPPGDPQALCRAMQAMLASPGWARSLGRQGREHVRSRFSIETMVWQHEALYARLIGRRPDGAKPAGDPSEHRAESRAVPAPLARAVASTQKEALS